MQSKTVLSSIICGLMLSSASVLASDIKQGGTLTVPIIGTGFVENYNPYTSKDLLHGVMFEPLMVFNNMTGKTEWRLAESATYSDDLTSIELKLRKGLKWSDGSPLTAKDVAYSFTMTKENGAFDQRGIWTDGNLISIEATDDSTVVFKLTEADSTFIWNLEKYHIIPEKVWSKASNLTTFTNPNPIGSGPMTEVKYVKTQQMELCRNPHYYLDGLPHLDCITYRSYNDNSQIQPALMKGEIDWGSNFIADIDNTFVAASPENHHYWYPANDAIHLYVNTKEAPFSDLELRKALSIALDRESIVDIAAYGYPTVNFNAGGIGELYSTYIDADVTAKYKDLTTYNPEKANQMLDAAGYVDKNNDGFRQTKDGKRIEFDIEVVNGWTDWIQVVQMVTEYYEEVGIKANVKTVDWAVYDSSLKDSTYKMAINWSLVATHPILAYQDYYSSSRVGKTWHGGHGVHTPEIDALIESFGQTNDSAEQADIIKQLQVFSAENLPFIPLFSNPTWFQYNSSKIVGWPNAENPYVQPVWYDGGKRVLIINNLHLK
ncbi:MULTISPECIES: ABC transporter substrate-binding protein [unclassified Agarivorans]|uniref:ABC transporter substrate-binding protein n=1 Tax=unclassified Agarivorans TaxID=2636026 RepID=UPI0026E3E797|nr:MULTISPECIES: ABC transporter substrate-binding protein [unclassified Agarivorans]MDO6684646.1 ABC transporter substrate-binding protein [Agarivorans sp. 3_MG-2023]MDO6714811.1 ABC transporter substrate-binding protein [Agarivorans sp. 2_MG-2023]MDO6762798.1 ABC transporter substrate-binding protein [Agarivorans sp. 1_MG-2023]